MTKRVKLTVAAANTIMRSIRWRSYSTEYQVMVKRVGTHPDSGKEIVMYGYPYARRFHTYEHPSPIRPQHTYRDAMLEIDRLSEDDRANAVIFRIKVERPA